MNNLVNIWLSYISIYYCMIAKICCVSLNDSGDSQWKNEFSHFNLFNQDSRFKIWEESFRSCQNEIHHSFSYKLNRDIGIILLLIILRINLEKWGGSRIHEYFFITMYRFVWMKKMGSSVHLLEWDDAFQDGYRLTHSNASFTSNKPYNLISINNEGKIISH